MLTPTEMARLCATMNYPRDEIVAALVKEAGVTEEEAARLTDEALEKTAQQFQ